MSQLKQGQQHDRTALILYGSETGNSQDAAEDLARVAERLHFTTRVSEMDEVDIKQLLRYTFVIFVTSTTGQGEFPKNARKFWRSLLRKSLRPDCLSHVSFTTFGLGDSSYVKFNWAALKLHKRLSQLGAQEIYPRGEGDEQHEEGIEGSFLPWSADLSKHLLSLYPLPNGITPIPSDVLLLPKHHLVIYKTSGFSNDIESSEGTNIVNERPEIGENGLNGSLSTTSTEKAHNEPLPIPGGITANLTRTQRVTPESHWQDVRHLSFTAPSNELPQYEPGDVITIYPKNFQEDVQELINIMDWIEVADKPLEILADSTEHLSIKGLYTLPNTTLRQLLIHNLDITAIPNRYFFHQISHYTNDEMHKERLLEFCNPVYSDEFFDYTTRPRRSILEVLQDFPSVKLPWKYATSLFPIIRGRQFSIASGGRLSQSATSGYIKVELLIAIVRYRTVLRKVRQGLCSRYITSLPENSMLRVTYSSNNKFYDQAKKNPRLPVIMIAPGTGVAPCRSLIHERAQTSLQDIGESILFFGNRNSGADYFFSSEWPSIPLLKVFTAFSRDQKAKIYIQDVIREQGSLVKKLVDDGAIVVVCGSSGAMPKSVRQALLAVLGDGAEEKLKSMEDRGRFVQETW